MTRRRPLPQRPKRRSILVLTEGTKTEPDYIKHWYRKYRAHLSVVIEGIGVDPRSLVDRGIEEHREAAQEEKRGRGHAYSSVWVVFDHDEHPDVVNQVVRARQAGLRVAFSNPCIELWFLLHFQDQTAYIERHAAQRQVSNHLSEGKAISEQDFDQLSRNHGIAMGRAISLERMHTGNGSSPSENPSSTVWQLIEDICA